RRWQPAVPLRKDAQPPRRRHPAPDPGALGDPERRTAATAAQPAARHAAGPPGAALRRNPPAGAARTGPRSQRALLDVGTKRRATGQAGDPLRLQHQPGAGRAAAPVRRKRSINPVLADGVYGALTSLPPIWLKSEGDNYPARGGLRRTSRLMVEGERSIRLAILRRLRPW